MALSTLPTGLVGYWTWDEASGDALDKAGWGANGVLTDGVRVAGKIGSGFQPSLATGKTTVASTLALSAMTVVSVQVWANLAKAFSAMWGTRHVLAQKSLNEGGTDAGWFLGSLDGSNTVVFRVMDAAGSAYTASYTEAATSGWVHYVGVFDGTYARLYRNGTQVAQAFVSGVLGWDVNQNLTIGTGFEGVIDEVAVWKRALSAGDVTSLYNTPGLLLHTGTFLYPPGLASWTDDFTVMFTAPPNPPAALPFQSLVYMEQTEVDPSAPPAVLPKPAGESWAIGATIYWNAAGGYATTSAAGNSLLGTATVAAPAGTTTGAVQLQNPIPGTSLGTGLAAPWLPAMPDGFQVYQPPLAGGAVTYQDPGALLLGVIADDTHLVTCTAEAGPSDALPMRTVWAIELIPGSLYIRGGEKLSNDFTAGRRNDVSFFQIPEGYDFRNLKIRFELYSQDPNQFWVTDWFTMSGENFYNERDAGPEPLPAAVSAQVVDVIGVPADGVVNLISDLHPPLQGDTPNFSAAYGFWSVLSAASSSQPVLRNIYAARPQLDRLAVGVIEMLYTLVNADSTVETKRYQLRVIAG